MKNQDATPEPNTPKKPGAYSRSHPSTGSVPKCIDDKISTIVKFFDKHNADEIQWDALDDLRENIEMILGYAETQSLGKETMRRYTNWHPSNQAVSSNSRAAPGSGWIAVEDRMPEQDEVVCLYEKARGMWIGARGEIEFGSWAWGNSYGTIWHNGKRWDGDNDCDDDYAPTHWHPLPSLPNNKSTNAEGNGK